MADRKPISKNTRFEVFKRDSFKCQYCGKSAPDVTLHVDHIIPVAEGGKNVITNYITSCIDCNLGKGARTLDDNSVLEKQKRQMDELSERREQLKMMVKWREGLNKLDEDKINYIEKRIGEICNRSFTDYGRNEMKKVIKKFDYPLILDAVEKSAVTYLKKDNDEDKYTSESISKFIEYIPRVCNGILIQAEHPEYKEINYIKGIMRNRFSYYNAADATRMIREAYGRGVDLETINSLAKTSCNWSEFKDSLEDY